MSEGSRNPDQFDPEPFPDPEEYAAYLDGLEIERIATIDRDLEAMFEADQQATRAGLNFCDAAMTAFDEIERKLRGL